MTTNAEQRNFKEIEVTVSSLRSARDALELRVKEAEQQLQSLKQELVTKQAYLAAEEEKLAVLRRDHVVAYLRQLCECIYCVCLSSLSLLRHLPQPFLSSNVCC